MPGTIGAPAHFSDAYAVAERDSEAKEGSSRSRRDGRAPPLKAEPLRDAPRTRSENSVASDARCAIIEDMIAYVDEEQKRQEAAGDGRL